MADAPKSIRSPSYPSIALNEAVAATAKIESQYRAAPVDRLVAVKLIGFLSLSGPSQKMLADLAAFGFLERAGKGQVRVTERARDILHPRSEQDRKEKLIAAALEPPLYREIRDRFPGLSVPPEDGVVTYLNRQGFNPNAVRPAAKAYLETMGYLEELGASDSDGVAAPAGEHEGAPAKSDTLARMVHVGDFVQRTSGGVEQFRVPPRVVGIFPDGHHVQVFGSNTGIPMDELTVVDPPSPAKSTGAARTEVAAGSAPDDNYFSVLQHGNRLQITADVDLEGIATLKDMLSDYESILRRLAGKGRIKTPDQST